MKIKITFKDPDGVSESIDEAVGEQLDVILGMSSEDKDSIREARTTRVYSDLRKWIKYGEYLSVEFDTEAGTATVLPAR